MMVETHNRAQIVLNCIGGTLIQYRMDVQTQAREGNSFEQEWVCHEERISVERFDSTDGQGAREHCWGRVVFSPTNREPCLPP